MLGLPDAVWGIVFWRHIWRQKAGKLHARNHLPSFGKRISIWWTKSLRQEQNDSYSFITPGLMMTVKTIIGTFVRRSWASDWFDNFHLLFDTRHGVKKRCQTWHRIINARITRCRMRHRFLTPCLASKSWQTWCLQSLAKLRLTSLH